jgi:hypothetical protein
MKAREILLGEGLTEQDIQELKNQLEEVNNDLNITSKVTDADILKEYYNQKSNRLQRGREKLPRKVEETKEYIERFKMGDEDVRSQKLQTVEEKRQEVMKRPTVKEKGVLDESDIYGNKGKSKGFGEAVRGTGVGLHTMFGETHRKAKLTNAEVNEIRRRIWVNKEQQVALAKEYGVAPTSITHIAKRETWSHLPRIEGEPDDVYNAPNQNDLKVMKKAKKFGVEPVRNKIGRLKLPDGTIKAVRAAAKMAKQIELKE